VFRDLLGCSAVWYGVGCFFCGCAHGGVVRASLVDVGFVIFCLGGVVGYRVCAARCSG